MVGLGRRKKVAKYNTMRRRRYLSYLLRLWLPDNAGRPIWRGSLEDPNTGHRLAFADLSSLFEYLQKETEGQSREPADEEQD
jgi:hypothetical protein